MDKLFREFLMEKEYVCGLSPMTIKGYNVTWRTFNRIIKNPEVTKETFLMFVKIAKEEGLTTGTINTHISALNSFLTWLRENGHNPDNIRIKKLKKEKKMQPCYIDDELKKMIRYKPQTWPQTRLHMMVLTLIDTGCRIDEMITLKRSGVDFENMLITIRGKFTCG